MIASDAFPIETNENDHQQQMACLVQRDGNIIKSNGVFFHQKYVMTPLGEKGFRAYAENDDRTDIFRLEDDILFHSAIAKYGDEPSVQSQVFSCALRR